MDWPDETRSLRSCVVRLPLLLGGGLEHRSWSVPQPEVLLGCRRICATRARGCFKVSEMGCACGTCRCDYCGTVWPSRKRRLGGEAKESRGAEVGLHPRDPSAYLMRAMSNQSMHRMSAPPCQSRDRGFIGRAPSSVALPPALIGDLRRWAALNALSEFSVYGLDARGHRAAV